MRHNVKLCIPPPPPHTHFSVIRATLDLEEIGYRLPDEYKETLSADLSKLLECEFHCCGYNNLIEIIAALRTVCGHLVKV